jgi:hypothetical protein
MFPGFYVPLLARCLVSIRYFPIANRHAEDDIIVWQGMGR